MMPPQALQEYFGAIQREYTTGNPTEHTYRPALKAFLERLAPGVTATNEPKRIACGAPDYALTRASGYGPLTVGYVEAKDIGKLVTDIERTDQLRRYLRALPNFVLTDYLEFRWYTDGALRQTARLAAPGGGRTLVWGVQPGGVEQLLSNFLEHAPQRIATPQDLALRMARLTHIIRDIVIEAFATGNASDLVRDWRKAFADVLIADLDRPEKVAEFADMFAQTLAYGLFSARVMDTTPDDFSRQEAQRLIPRTNPFLRQFFADISGIRLDDEPFVGFVDDLAALLAQTDMRAVLANFGKRTRQEDPVVHFYETFLAAYDPALRETRGVYYTPEPVVSYIVRSVDVLLKARFKLRDGLADTAKVRVDNTDPSLKVKNSKDTRKTMESHRVLILDPACGTATFPYAVVDHIRSAFMERGDAGMWSSYVREHLLPRLFGFELLMAPYAVAHFKLGLQLAGRDLPEAERAVWAYDFVGDERLNLYLTNTLEGPHEFTGLPLFTQFVSDETNAANRVKRDLPIMVVLGNPPYSGHSANKGTWIKNLLRGKDTQTGLPTANYFAVDGQPLGEKNPKWLNDDYVKFIRFAQWRIERSGAGILAFISNNGYLDNPTFRGMRQALMETFSDIYLLDLHGNSNKREVAPDGSPDQNVFDIQQGVAIGIFVKEPGKQAPAKVHHADLWGVREVKDKQGGKYPWLLKHDLADTSWQELSPQSPLYMFVPRDIDLAAEYEQGWKLNEILPLSAPGIVTGQDSKTIAFTTAEAESLARQLELPEERITSILYRPFDWRSVVYDGSVVTRPRTQVMRHLLAGENKALIATRQTRDAWGVLATSSIIGHKALAAYDINTLFPLYRYPDANLAGPTLFDAADSNTAPGGRCSNFTDAFVADMETHLRLRLVADGRGDLQATFGPEDAFDYIYAVFHSPTYRQRYSEFLKTDFPCVPLTGDVDLFRTLCDLGRRLVAVHLMERRGPRVVSYPAPGDNKVQAVRYVPPEGQSKGRVYINKTQYFEGVSPEVWGVDVGGYQVAEKWLKDRGDRLLVFEDLTDYMDIIGGLVETMHLMQQIDGVIPGWPLG